MQSERPMIGPGGAVRVTVGPGWGWSHHDVDGNRVSLKGYIFNGARTLEGESAARHAAKLLSPAKDDDALGRALKELAGHFALVLTAPTRTIATVDRVRSIPLAYASRDGTTLIDDRGRRLRDVLGLGPADIDPKQALAAAMSGYTIGPTTIYRGLDELGVGEALVVDEAGTRKLRWFLYDAWRTESIDAPERKLSDLHRFLIERLVKSADGRAIVVPLSAGYDSRFIAAGLKAAGAKDVRLFSYGRAGNHEAETARAIAERLGYPWKFVDYTTRNQSAKHTDRDYVAALWETADSCVATPFEQDWTAVETLKDNGYIPGDALIVNGQSGDFITGNHAPLSLIDHAATQGLTADQRLEGVTKPFLKKHYRLWQKLATKENDAVIVSMLAAQAEAAGIRFDTHERLHGAYEYLEYVNRQAKYVVSGQRAYEAMGFTWRLPLWDDEFILFWRRAPAELKRAQGLYRRVLEQDNWAGVFNSIPVNRKTITPGWIVPLRFAAKVACAPMGTDGWHRVERRVFGWWMDPLRMAAVVPYSFAISDSRGARHGVSWLTEKWLAGHGRNWDGSQR